MWNMGEMRQKRTSGKSASMVVTGHLSCYCLEVCLRCFVVFQGVSGKQEP